LVILQNKKSVLQNLQHFVREDSVLLSSIYLAKMTKNKRHTLSFAVKLDVSAMCPTVSEN
jgi:hypothetical protein